MPTVDLSTTNLLLGIMAAVSVLQALVLIGAGVAGFLVYKRVTQLVADLEARQVAPLREKVEAILADVKTVTSRVNQQTERVDHAISGTMDRVDETAERVRHSVPGQGESGDRRGARHSGGRRVRADQCQPGGRSDPPSRRPAVRRAAGTTGRSKQRTHQEGTWHTNTIGSSGKMAADRF